MSDIKVMSTALSNQIAAGEVIERPASVVKELVENAIDADSTQIDITVEEAGLKMIRVTDNGKGMTNEDAKLAFERHATSKLIDREDLFRIRTLGFRGEALPSIASVSRLILETAPEAGAGQYLQVKGGEIVEAKPAQARKGTTVTVSDLFYNTPARLKYISSLKTEMAHITDLINRFALAHPDIAFRLSSDGKSVTRTVGNDDLQQAIAGVYGVETARKMLPITGENFNFKISGYTSLPELTRANRKYMTLIVNGRVVKSFSLNKAIETGYGSKLMINRSPIAVLTIEMDPYLVDVNVHPTKQTVRISEEKELGQLIKKTINDALHKETRIPEGLANIDANRRTRQDEKYTQTQMPLKTSQKEDVYPDEIGLRYDKDSGTYTPKDALENFDPAEMQVAEAYDEVLLEKEMHIAEDPLKTAEKRLKDNRDAVDVEGFPEFEYIGQMHGTYLFAQNEKGLYLIDQHAAQERIKYEYYRVEIGKESADQQQLLMPIMLEYPADEAILIEAHQEKLQEVGLYIEPFGDRTFIMQSHPAWFVQGQEEATAKEMIDFFLSKEAITLSEFREATAIMMSCKRSIKANHHLQPNEARQLLADLRETENPYNCPHGRPVLVHLSTTDIEKMFKRIQDRG